MPSHLFRSMYQPVQDIAYEDEPEKTEDLNDIAFQYRHLQDGFRSFSQKAVNSRYVMFGNTVLFVASLAMLLTSISFVSRMNVSTQQFQDTCTPEDVSSYSPIFNKLPVTLSSKKINGTFWPQETPSIFQQLPSPEVDLAWGRISDTSGISLTSQEIRDMGYSVEESWPWPPIDAPEGDSYMGIIDVFHQIHCLDMLRRSIFTEYYGNLREIYKDGLFPFTDHILHCQYVLMQALTCNADLEVVTFNKVQGFKGPFADFGVQKKCRNWDEILEWKEKHQIMPKGDTFKKTPEGIIQIPALGNAVPFPSFKGQEHGNVE